MEAALALAPEPKSAAAARLLVDATLPDWGCGELIESARLVITELVSNAIRHAGTPIEVRIELLPRALRLGVADAAGDEGAVQMMDARPGAPPDTRGRGLRIVGELVDRWGVDHRPGGGKVVWAEWRLPR